MADDAVFIAAVTFTPSYVGQMSDTAEKDYSADFAFGKNANVGLVLGGRVGRDVNRFISLHTMAVVVGNEDKYAWIVLNNATKAGDPHFGEARTSDVCDADKGAAAESVEVFDDAVQKFGYLHRLNTITKTPAANGGGAVGAEEVLREVVARARRHKKLDADQDRGTTWKSPGFRTVPRCGSNPNEKARVDLNEVRNGGPAACDNLCMVLTKTPCKHVHAAAVAAKVSIMSIVCPELTTAHWKAQYAGTGFPLPSEAGMLCLRTALSSLKYFKFWNDYIEYL